MSDRDKYPSEAAERFQVRLPPGMRDRIRAAAERNNRSMNAEIIKLIGEGFEQRDHFEQLEALHRQSSDPDLDAAIDEYHQEMHDERLREHDRQRMNSTSFDRFSQQMEKIEKKLDQLTKGFVVYGRAFELSVAGDQERSNAILDRAIQEVEDSIEDQHFAPLKRIGEK